jgi:hypothetical protein
VLALAGCTTVAPCKSGTILLSLSLPGAQGSADQLAVSVAIGGGNAMLTTVPHTPGRASGTLEIDFPSGYPTGQSVSVGVTAIANGAVVGAKQTTIPAVAGCASGGLTLVGSGSGPVDLATGLLDLGTCTGNQTACAGNIALVCDGAGNWIQTVCSGATPACLQGACVPCAPPARQCAGQQPQTCSASGSWTNDGPACSGNTMCSGGSCVCGKATCNGACVDTTIDGANCGWCGHSCLDSTCMGSVCVPVPIVTNLGGGNQGWFVFGIALDPTHNRIYFTNGSGGEILYCPLSGCPNNKPSVLYGPIPFAQGLFYIPAFDMVFVADGNNGGIYAVSSSGILKWSISGEGRPFTFATDGSNLYWTSYTNGMNGVGVVRSVPAASGGTPQTLLSEPGDFAAGLVYDAASGNLIVGFGGGPGAVVSYNLASGAKVSVANGDWFNPGWTLIQGSTIYFGTYGNGQDNFSKGGIYSAPLGSSTSVSTVVAGPLYSNPNGMVMDAQYLYFYPQQGSNPNATDVLRVPVGGGKVDSLIKSVGSPGAGVTLAIDSKYVYFGNFLTVARVAK